MNNTSVFNCLQPCFTATALGKVTERLQTEAAFDTVDHVILLHCWETLGGNRGLLAFYSHISTTEPFLSPWVALLPQ